MVQVPPWVPAPAQVAVPLALVVSLTLVWRLDSPQGRWGRRLRSRFLLGVPWGTLVSVLGVLAVYLFVQQGWSHWYDPVTLPFSSWSYLYPVGWLFAAFSHTGPAHIVGNLTTALAVGPLAEYYFGHFPTKRGENPFFSWTTNPWIRAFVVFPAGVALVGLATSLFAWGPIIGFSGVVFALVGFALVRYPLMTVVAVSAQGAIRTAYHAVRNPVVTGSASSHFGRPWWYGIAVQGHVLGLLLGVLLGVLVLYRRRERVGALRLWTGAVVLAMSMSLWALWWYRGEGTYVLYRGLGVAFVVTLGALTAVAATADRRPLFGDVSRQQVGLLVVLLPLAVMVGVAVPVNLTAVNAAGAPGTGPAVHARGYTVTYAENVPNEKVSVVDVSLFGETTNVTTSGVIVVNPDREIWSQAVSKGRLAFAGRAHVRVGGVGWSRVIAVKRRGWSALGGGTAYQVWLRERGDESWMHAYSSGPAVAGPTLANRTVAVVPRDGRFVLRISRLNTSAATAPIPAVNESVTLDGIRFAHEGHRLFAAYNGTRIRIASRETYH